MVKWCYETGCGYSHMKKVWLKNGTLRSAQVICPIKTKVSKAALTLTSSIKGFTAAVFYIFGGLRHSW